VVILADDLGYGDVSFNGCPDYTTLNIDSIAASGALITDAMSVIPFAALPAPD
jgi:arylsulfatase A-like enzyme